MLAGLRGLKAGKTIFCKKAASGRLRVKRMVWGAMASTFAMRLFGAGAGVGDRGGVGVSVDVGDGPQEIGERIRKTNVNQANNS